MSEKEIVLITGASSGIGKEAAKLLAARGLKVYGAARNLDKMSELTAYGVEILPLDVTNEKSVDACVNRILEKEKRIDILVNNAGYGSFGAVEVVPMDEARRQFEVNVFGLGLLIQKVLPAMRAQKNGRIVNIASIAAYFGEPNGGWYHATKAAVERLSDSLRMELKPFGIAVSIIEPGLIDTEWQGIAQQHLLKTSAGTPYEATGTSQAKSMDRTYRFASKPIVVARAISDACTAKRPKIRYRVGGYARPFVFLSTHLPVRLFDRVMMRALRG